MMKAWYLREGHLEDRRQPAMTDPPRFVDLEHVSKETGVQFRKVEGNDFKNNSALKEIEEDYDLTAQDVLEISADLPQEKFDRLYKEHLHTTPEIRFVLDGDGYLDVRDQGDQWIRVHVTHGDVLMVPPGVYHRFTVTTQNYIKVKRYFVGHLCWLAFNRAEPGTDKLPERIGYLAQMCKS